MDRASAITIGPDLVPAGYDTVVGGSDLDRLEALGSALVASPGWPPRLGVVLTEDPGPLLVLAGPWDEEDERDLATLRQELSSTRVRYIDYREVESLTEVLADRIRPALGQDGGWHYAAVPRGGLVVLGILSYLLDLPHGAIVSPDAEVESLVLVDDCSISGARLTRVLSETRASRLVLATLVSPAPLRAAVVDRFPMVDDFVSAEDLVDRAPDRLGEDYPAWRERWEARGDDLWVGRTDHLSFPWNEPDVGVWSEPEGALRPGWRLIPPGRCLKNRSAEGDHPRMHRFRRGHGPLRQASMVVDVDVPDGTVLVDLERGRTMPLDPVAADMWHALMEGGSAQQAARIIQGAYEVDATTVERDMEAFVARLTAAGVLDIAEHQEPS